MWKCENAATRSVPQVRPVKYDDDISIAGQTAKK